MKKISIIPAIVTPLLMILSPTILFADEVQPPDVKTIIDTMEELKSAPNACLQRPDVLSFNGTISLGEKCDKMFDVICHPKVQELSTEKPEKTLQKRYQDFTEYFVLKGHPLDPGTLEYAGAFNKGLTEYLNNHGDSTVNLFHDLQKRFTNILDEKRKELADAAGDNAVEKKNIDLIFDKMKKAVSNTEIDTSKAYDLCIGDQRNVVVTREVATQKTKLTPCAGAVMMKPEELVGLMAKALSSSLDPCSMDMMELDAAKGINMAGVFEPLRTCLLATTKANGPKDKQEAIKDYGAHPKFPHCNKGITAEELKIGEAAKSQKPQDQSNDVVHQYWTDKMVASWLHEPASGVKEKDKTKLLRKAFGSFCEKAEENATHVDPRKLFTNLVANDEVLRKELGCPITPETGSCDYRLSAGFGELGPIGGTAVATATGRANAAEAAATSRALIAGGATDPNASVPPTVVPPAPAPGAPAAAPPAAPGAAPAPPLAVPAAGGGAPPEGALAGPGLVKPPSATPPSSSKKVDFDKLAKARAKAKEMLQKLCFDSDPSGRTGTITGGRRAEDILDVCDCPRHNSIEPVDVWQGSNIKDTIKVDDYTFQVKCESLCFCDDKDPNKTSCYFPQISSVKLKEPPPGFNTKDFQAEFQKNNPEALEYAQKNINFDNRISLLYQSCWAKRYGVSASDCKEGRATKVSPPVEVLDEDSHLKISYNCGNQCGCTNGNPDYGSCYSFLPPKGADGKFLPAIAGSSVFKDEEKPAQYDIINKPLYFGLSGKSLKEIGSCQQPAAVGGAPTATPGTSPPAATTSGAASSALTTTAGGHKITHEEAEEGETTQPAPPAPQTAPGAPLVSNVHVTWRTDALDKAAKAQVDAESMPASKDKDKQLKDAQQKLQNAKDGLKKSLIEMKATPENAEILAQRAVDDALEQAKKDAFALARARTAVQPAPPAKASPAAPANVPPAQWHQPAINQNTIHNAAEATTSANHKVENQLAALNGYPKNSDVLKKAASIVKNNAKTVLDEAAQLQAMAEKMGKEQPATASANLQAAKKQSDVALEHYIKALEANGVKPEDAKKLAKEAMDEALKKARKEMGLNENGTVPAPTAPPASKPAAPPAESKPAAKPAGSPPETPKPAPTSAAPRTVDQTAVNNTLQAAKAANDEVSKKLNALPKDPKLYNPENVKVIKGDAAAALLKAAAARAEAERVAQETNAKPQYGDSSFQAARQLLDATDNYERALIASGVDPVEAKKQAHHALSEALNRARKGMVLNENGTAPAPAAASPKPSPEAAKAGAPPAPPQTPPPALPAGGATAPAPPAKASPAATPPAAPPTAPVAPKSAAPPERLMEPVEHPAPSLPSPPAEKKTATPAAPAAPAPAAPAPPSAKTDNNAIEKSLRTASDANNQVAQALNAPSPDISSFLGTTGGSFVAKGPLGDALAEATQAQAKAEKKLLEAKTDEERKAANTYRSEAMEQLRQAQNNFDKALGETSTDPNVKKSRLINARMGVNKILIHARRAAGLTDDGKALAASPEPSPEAAKTGAPPAPATTPAAPPTATKPLAPPPAAPATAAPPSIPSATPAITEKTVRDQLTMAQKELVSAYQAQQRVYHNPNATPQEKEIVDAATKAAELNYNKLHIEARPYTEFNFPSSNEIKRDTLKSPPAGGATAPAAPAKAAPTATPPGAPASTPSVTPETADIVAQAAQAQAAAEAQDASTSSKDKRKNLKAAQRQLEKAKTKLIDDLNKQGLAADKAESQAQKLMDDALKQAKEVNDDLNDMARGKKPLRKDLTNDQKSRLAGAAYENFLDDAAKVTEANDGNDQNRTQFLDTQQSNPTEADKLATDLKTNSQKTLTQAAQAQAMAERAVVLQKMAPDTDNTFSPTDAILKPSEKQLERARSSYQKATALTSDVTPQIAKSQADKARDAALKQARKEAGLTDDGKALFEQARPGSPAAPKPTPPAPQTRGALGPASKPAAAIAGSETVAPTEPVEHPAPSLPSAPLSANAPSSDIFSSSGDVMLITGEAANALNKAATVIVVAESMPATAQDKDRQLNAAQQQLQMAQKKIIDNLMTNKGLSSTQAAIVANKMIRSALIQARTTASAAEAAPATAKHSKHHTDKQI